MADHIPQQSGIWTLPVGCFVGWKLDQAVSQISTVSHWWERSPILRGTAISKICKSPALSIHTQTHMGVRNPHPRNEGRDQARSWEALSKQSVLSGDCCLLRALHAHVHAFILKHPHSHTHTHTHTFSLLPPPNGDSKSSGTWLAIQYLWLSHSSHYVL